MKLDGWGGSTAHEVIDLGVVCTLYNNGLCNTHKDTYNPNSFGFSSLNPINYVN